MQRSTKIIQAKLKPFMDAWKKPSAMKNFKSNLKLSLLTREQRIHMKKDARKLTRMFEVLSRRAVKFLVCTYIMDRDYDYTCPKNTYEEFSRLLLDTMKKTNRRTYTDFLCKDETIDPVQRKIMCCFVERFLEHAMIDVIYPQIRPVPKEDEPLPAQD